METWFDQVAATFDQPYRVERAAMVARHILEHVPLAADSRVLDFGCGTGLLGGHFAGLAGPVTFADISAKMLAQVDGKIRQQEWPGCQTLDLGKVPLAGSWDLIVSLMALHHIDDHRGTIGDLAACLAPGGALCLCDLVTEDGSFHPDEVVPHNGFDPAELVDLLEARGLKVFLNETVYTVKYAAGGTMRDFPLFLVAARRS